MALPNRFGQNDGEVQQNAVTPSDQALVSYVVEKVRRARDIRDVMYEERWREYTRLWRGFWLEKDKNTDSERSRIVAPALQQAVEMTVAEIEETVFGNHAWFDVDDDLQDPQKEDALQYRDQLLEDFEIAEVPSAVSQCALLGAIYGTGLGKINVTVKDIPETNPESGETVMRQRVLVTLDPMRPDETVVDPAARNVDEAEFIAHEPLRPRHIIRAKQASGIYKKGMIGSWNREQRADTTGTNFTLTDQTRDGVLVTEYFGKVPAGVYRKPGESCRRYGRGYRYYC